MLFEGVADDYFEHADLVLFQLAVEPSSSLMHQTGTFNEDTGGMKQGRWQKVLKAGQKRSRSRPESNQ